MQVKYRLLTANAYNLGRTGHFKQPFFFFFSKVDFDLVTT